MVLEGFFFNYKIIYNPTQQPCPVLNGIIFTGHLVTVSGGHLMNIPLEKAFMQINTDGGKLPA